MNQKITAFLFGLLGTTLLICSCILALYFRQSSQQAALYSRLAASASHFDTGELTGNARSCISKILIWSVGFKLRAPASTTP